MASMSRTALHLRFIAGTLMISVLLTVLMIPVLSAGHASAVITVVSAMMLGHVLFAPSLLGAERTPAGLLRAGAIGAAVFLATGALFWLGMGPLEALFERVDEAGGESSFAIITGVSLALPVLFVAVSSALLELVWRATGPHRAVEGEAG